jgi:hypothetical protein
MDEVVDDAAVVVGLVVVVVRNVVKVVRDVVVGGVFECHYFRPLNFLITANICKGSDEQTWNYDFACNQPQIAHPIASSLSSSTSSCTILLES